MFFSENIFDSYEPLNWSWPLQFRILQKQEDPAQPAFSDLKETLINVKYGVVKGEKIDLAIFTDGLKQAVLDLTKLRFHAEVVLVLEENEDFETKKPTYLNNLRAITVKTNARGVFVFSIKKEVSSWLNEFIEQLYADKNIIEALKATAASGYFFFEKKTGVRSRLSYFINDMIFFLDNDDSFGSLNIDFEVSPDPSSYPGPKKAAALKEVFNHFLSKREDSEKLARGLKNLSIYRKAILEKQTKTGDRGWVTEARTEWAKIDVTDEQFEQVSAKLNYNRYLQVSLTKKGSEAVQKEVLAHSTDFLLSVRIGESDDLWISATSDPFPDFIFDESKSMKESIRILFMYNHGEFIQEKTIELPRFGNSTTALFEFLTPANGNVFECEIYAIHKNRVIQKLILTAPLAEVATADQKIKTKIVFCARKNLDNLDTRKDFNRSIMLDASADGEARLTDIDKHEAISLNVNKALLTIMQNIKDEVESAVILADQFPEDLQDPNNVSLLRRLAVMGNSLYANHLKRRSIDGPLQIYSNRDEFVPFDFIYNLPAPKDNAGLCEHAVQALQEGACKNCMNKEISPADHICPFGFLGLSHIIERHAVEKPELKGSGDYSILAEPSSGRDVLDILNNTLYGSAQRIEAVSPGLRNKFADCLTTNSKAPVAANDWEQWRNITQEKKPDTQVLIIHVEKHPEQPADRIELGTDFLLQNNFDDQRIKPKGSRISPLMIVLGCETADVNNHGFDISSQLINYGAAIVLSNFTRIRGRQAVPILIKLIELIKEEKKEMVFGEIVLKLKQQLLSKGIMVSLALVTYGDADWKIKA